MRSLKRAFGKVWMAAFGWEVEGARPDVPKAVVVAAPHTSNWDLPFMLATSYVLGLDIHWFGKHTLFAPPFGAIMRMLGGMPVDRRNRHNAVAATVDEFGKRDELMLLVPPEGTRSRTTHWKTGFYHIAVGANVPIILGFLDYEKKRGGLGHVFYPTGDIDADMPKIRAFYANVKGKIHHQTSDIAIRPVAPVISVVPSTPASEEAAE